MFELLVRRHHPKRVKKIGYFSHSVNFLVRTALSIPGDRLYPIILVDLKYVTPTQVIEYKYEGHIRKFAFHSATPVNASTKFSSTEVTGQLSRQLSKLSVESVPQLWTVSWDCDVSISTDDLSSREDTSHKASLQFCTCHDSSHDRACAQSRGKSRS